ncbi:hypothetical protein SAMN04515691_2379 [Leifsonia sp. 98AMF]|uniref:hypothetical protein n=1 Tax=unclassified Leifsonia TaxID=2663824 RepID=UPI000879E201|nr:MULTISPECIES: hypothetical protein [unclassified Leifsonia]SDH28204.1 hypothetical protein SAMN04515690_1638 [Leifsonia sp. 197AMF]SDJ10221.1 hypothetical protein SAMN04515684_2146 [Leifsonia sp. 466MF]SDJ60134.1 hypothetical protein SAMN04515683_0599 [Leifsonia sp. 157MF]SDN31509.1 hypothetical protein SAMN04515686_0329 [Leifsonia sp. 509MF]SEM89893.1 hypothetical protein SAMN04515685_0587 [Leifsonia sp. 467MF]
MSTRSARVARGLIAAGFATFVAALFHVAGGGLPPSAVALTLSLVFSGLGCIVLAGKRSALWRSASSVALSQFLFHALFSLSPSAHFAGATGHLHPGSHLTMVTDGAAATPMSAMSLSGSWMWLAHAAAALLTLAALRYGERVFVAVSEFTAFSLRRLLTAVAVVDVPVAQARVETVPVILPDRTVVLGRLRHRGPPALMGPA